jgi:GNAT superfamily N-acetyltransferase
MTRTIHPATESDCAAIVGLVHDLAREDGGSVDETAVARTVRQCLAADQHDLLVAAEGPANDLSVVGYVAVHWIAFPMLAGTEAYVSDLVVARDRRGSSVGGRLLAVVEERARARGCVRLMLNNRIAAESFRRGFYAKRGYRRRDEFASFVKNLS